MLSLKRVNQGNTVEARVLTCGPFPQSHSLSPWRAVLMPRFAGAIFQRSRNKRVNMVDRAQFEAGTFQRWVALSSILLILAFNTLEFVHTHATTSASSRCSICISLVGNVPAARAHPLPALRAVAIVPARRQSQRQTAAAGPTLFIRPPPGA